MHIETRYVLLVEVNDLILLLLNPISFWNEYILALFIRSIECQKTLRHLLNSSLKVVFLVKKKQKQVLLEYSPYAVSKWEIWKLHLLRFLSNYQEKVKTIVWFYFKVN